MTTTGPAGPAEDASSPPSGDRAAPVPSPTADVEASPRRRLLVVEDDWRSHSALRKIFTRLGWEVHSAMTVAGGLALLDKKPQGVVLDLMLPDGDGLGVLRTVRAERLAARVVITTGIVDGPRLDEVRRLGPDALLRKPYEFGDLLQALGGEEAS